MSRRIESLFLDGGAGRLEALLEEPVEEPIRAAVVCHPHPKGGGTMHNKVVYRLARALRQVGCVVLRFNYRGVNLSEGSYDEGRGEADDARTALSYIRDRYPDLPLVLGGFSFGSRVVMRVAEDQPAIERVIAAGFPTRVLALGQIGRVEVPKLFVQSTHDEYSPREEFEAFYAEVEQPKHLEWIEGEDHFFKGALDQFEQLIERLALLPSNYFER